LFIEKISTQTSVLFGDKNEQLWEKLKKIKYPSIPARLNFRFS